MVKRYRRDALRGVARRQGTLDEFPYSDGSRQHPRVWRLTKGKPMDASVVAPGVISEAVGQQSGNASAGTTLARQSTARSTTSSSMTGRTS